MVVKMLKKKSKSNFKKLVEKYGHMAVTAPMQYGMSKISSTVISTRARKGMVSLTLANQNRKGGKKC